MDFAHGHICGEELQPLLRAARLLFHVAISVDCVDCVEYVEGEAIRTATCLSFNSISLCSFNLLYI